MSTEEKVQKIVDKAYAFVVNELAKEGIKAESQTTDDCIFFDDNEQKKSFCVHISVNECAEYEGD